MKLSVYYSSPPLTAAEQQQLDEARKKQTPHKEPEVMRDITNYVTAVTWSGDTDQAARKFEFETAYNTTDKDEAFVPLDLQLGGFIFAFFAETDTDTPIEIFCGRIFFRKRNTSQFTYSYTAYDDMIYLAKSQVQLLFSNVTVTDAVRKACAEIGIPTADNLLAIPTTVNFVADGKSCTEIFKMLREKTQADTQNYPSGMDFTVVCILDKVTLIKKGETIENYIASDGVNVSHTEHSQSIEGMINRIKAVDSVGRVCQVFTINDDVTHYGMIQQVYKMQPPKEGETVDNVKAAKGQLKQLQEESSLEGIGNIQCISGYAITVQEEQLKGKFFIKSDSHKFDNNTHLMNLTLEYMPDTPVEPVIEQQDIATPIFNSTGTGKAKTTGGGNGNMDVNAGLSAGWDAWGNTTMDNGSEGCAEAAGKIGSYYSQFLAQEAGNGVVGVPQMVSDADSAGLLQDFNADDLEAGDCIVYGDNDHVVIYDGNGGYYGNSSSQMVTVHGGDYNEMGGLYPTKIIKASRG